MEVLLFNLHMTILIYIFQIIENCVNKCFDILHEKVYECTAIQSAHDNIGIYFR